MAAEPHAGTAHVLPARRVGNGEIATFLLLPALLPVIFGGDLRSAAAAVVGIAVILGIAYAVTSDGLLPMLWWAVGQTGRHLVAVGHLAARALPMLLLFSTFLFVNAELWQVAQDFTTADIARLTAGRRSGRARRTPLSPTCPSPSWGPWPTSRPSAGPIARSSSTTWSVRCTTPSPSALAAWPPRADPCAPDPGTWGARSGPSSADREERRDPRPN